MDKSVGDLFGPMDIQVHFGGKDVPALERLRMGVFQPHEDSDKETLQHWLARK